MGGTVSTGVEATARCGPRVPSGVTGSESDTAFPSATMAMDFGAESVGDESTSETAESVSSGERMGGMPAERGEVRVDVRADVEVEGSLPEGPVRVGTEIDSLVPLLKGFRGEREEGGVFREVGGGVFRGVEEGIPKNLINTEGASLTNPLVAAHVSKADWEPRKTRDGMKSEDGPIREEGRTYPGIDSG